MTIEEEVVAVGSGLDSNDNSGDGQSILAASSEGLLLAADDGKQDRPSIPQEDPRGGRSEPKRTDSDEQEVIDCEITEGISKGKTVGGLHESTCGGRSGTERGMNGLLGVKSAFGGMSSFGGMTSQSVRDIMRIVANECGVGEEEIDKMMTQISLCEIDSASEILVGETAGWEDVEFEVALDSGAVIHVCSAADTPGYNVQPSPGSRRGQQFMMGDGGKTPNQGQVALNLSNGGPASAIQSIFQVASVTRPLMSVGKICDEGYKVDFFKEYAVITDKNKREVLRFERQAGGLYTAKMKLKAPTFGRQE